MTEFVLHLADNALVLGHRNSEWTGHGPILEQDIALSNVALDLIGQARNLYQYAAQLIGEGANEDTLAYLRDPNEFRNILLVEQPNGHWGTTIMRQFLFSAYQFPLYNELANRKTSPLTAIAEKALKEVTYHLRWSSEWVIRLGLGTEESREKMKDALQVLWPYTEDMLAAVHHYLEPEQANKITAEWKERVKRILTEATLQIPQHTHAESGSFEGRHSQHLYNLLAEMQMLQRTYPGVEW